MKRAWPLAGLALLIVLAFLARAERNDPRRPAPIDVARESRVPPPLRPIDLPPLDAAAEAERETAGTPPESAPHKHVETEDVCLSSLKWLLHGQNKDGTWGNGPTSLEGSVIDRPGLTGLTLLSFLGAGYSHLSKDSYGGRCAGDAVRAAIQWLMADQREDGTFASSRSVLDHALAATALAEAYGLTGSNLFKDQAQKSIDALVQMQGQDGSWGSSAASAWAIQAVKVAEIADLGFPKSAYDGMRSYFDARARPDAREAVARVFIDKTKTHPTVANTVEWIAASHPLPGRSTLHDLYFESVALFQVDGPGGYKWKTWNEFFKTAVFSGQQRSGAWPGSTPSETVLNTALGSLCGQVYYR